MPEVKIVVKQFIYLTMHWISNSGLLKVRLEDELGEIV